jgi:hypothetical protein
LDLLPAALDDDVECGIRIINLDENAEYEALSYCWGETRHGKTIEVSGKPITVTTNLYAALRRLRYATTKRTLWVDQLCINQWDIEEKATQVAMMRDIYRKCRHCILWLGEIHYEDCVFDEEHTEAVFDFIRLLGALPEPNLAALWRPEMHRSCCAIGTPTLFCDGYNGYMVRQAFAAFAMYGNPWWERIWTLQESALPKSADYVWGSHSVAREDVIRLVQRLRGDGLASFPPEFQRLREYYRPLLRSLFYPVHGIIHFRKGDDGAMNLCMRWRHRQATDPRDKVYALLGLLPAHSLPSAQPCSYTIPVPTLFSNVTLDLLESERSLLPLVASSELEHRTPELPSWAIDFACSNRIGFRQLKWWNHSHRYRQFKACGDHALQLKVAADNGLISLTGVFIDEVREVNGVYSVLEDESLEHRRVLKAIVSSRKLVERHRQTATMTYIGGGLWSSAWWRTMIGDLVMDEFPVERAKTAHEVDFAKLWQELGDGETDVASNVLYESLCGMIPNHAFFITKTGYIGIGPPNTQSGDQVWVLYGGQVPFILRRSNLCSIKTESRGMQLIGDAYVHGIMDGEAVPEDHQAYQVTIH